MKTVVYIDDITSEIYTRLRAAKSLPESNILLDSDYLRGYTAALYDVLGYVAKLRID